MGTKFQILINFLVFPIQIRKYVPSMSKIQSMKLKYTRFMVNQDMCPVKNDEFKFLIKIWFLDEKWPFLDWEIRLCEAAYGTHHVSFN